MSNKKCNINCNHLSPYFFTVFLEPYLVILLNKLLKQERIPFYVYWASCVNMIFKQTNTKFITNTPKKYKYITRTRDKNNKRKKKDNYDLLVPKTFYPLHIVEN